MRSGSARRALLSFFVLALALSGIVGATSASAAVSCGPTISQGYLKVVWTFSDGTSHNVTATETRTDCGNATSGPLQNGATYPLDGIGTYRVDFSGVPNYTCGAGSGAGCSVSGVQLPINGGTRTVTAPYSPAGGTCTSNCGGGGIAPVRCHTDGGNYVKTVTVASGQQVHLRGEDATGHYDWSGGGNPSSATDRQDFYTTFTNTSSAGINVSVRVDSGGYSDFCTVTVNPQPVQQPTPVTCSPVSQLAIAKQGVSVSASGGTGSYTWSASGGSPSSGTGATFPTVFSLHRVRTVTVSDGRTSATCTVDVITNPGFTSTGGALQGTPALVNSKATGTTYDVFARGTNNHLMHYAYTGNTTDAWKDLGVSIATDPSAVSPATGRIDVFAIGTDGNLKHVWTTNHTTWTTSSWGPVYGQPAVVSDNPGHIMVFARASASDAGIYGISYDLTNTTILPVLGTNAALDAYPAATSWGSGHSDVIWRTSSGTIGHRALNNNALGTLETIPRASGVAGRPSIATWGPGQLDIAFRVGTAPYTMSFSGNAWWGSPDRLGGAITSDVVVQDYAGNLIDYFGKGTDNAVWHAAYRNGLAAWQVLGNPVVGSGGIGTLIRTSNRYEIWVIGANGQAYKDVIAF